MTKAEVLPHDPGKEHIYTKATFPRAAGCFVAACGVIRSCAVHLQSAAPCLSDSDPSTLVSVSPLYKTLQEIQQSLKNLTTAESHHLHNGAET